MNDPPVKCKHWRACGIRGGGCCVIDAYRQPSYGVCLRVCQQYQGPPRGVGDHLSNGITRLTGVEPCGGCKERAAGLNRLTSVLWVPPHVKRALEGE